MSDAVNWGNVPFTEDEWEEELELEEAFAEWESSDEAQALIEAERRYQLTEAALEGDEDAYEELVEEFGEQPF